MPRARNIKHSFFSNDVLADIDPLGRLLFIGMWTLADYKGDFEWREKKVKASILPYDNCDIKKLAINLDKSGFIRFYSDGDKVFVRIVNFSKHQNPHKNERDKGTDIPEYCDNMRQAIDLKALTINRDKSRGNQESSASDPADSCFLNPDSGSLKDDSRSPEKTTSPPIVVLDFSSITTAESQIDEIKRIRKANNTGKAGKLSQRMINGLAKEFEKADQLGWTLDECLTEWEVRGWKSFKAEWIQTKQRTNGVSGDVVTIDQFMEESAAQARRVIDSGFLDDME